MAQDKVIFLNRKPLLKESSILKFGKNQDNYLIKNIDEIDSLTRNILRGLVKNKKSNNIFVLNLTKKKLKLLHKKNLIKKVNNKCRKVRKYIK
ncbi:MAG: hypothetical protein LBC92_05315 [Rickettsiales bacterium]|jgi:hypothetical protein|nr:hypothetical protein [Rickettsiales bacterium]